LAEVRSGIRMTAEAQTKLTAVRLPFIEPAGDG
jgi:hypothetical protein